MTFFFCLFIFCFVGCLFFQKGSVSLGATVGYFLLSGSLMILLVYRMFVQFELMQLALLSFCFLVISQEIPLVKKHIKRVIRSCKEFFREMREQ